MPCPSNPDTNASPSPHRIPCAGKFQCHGSPYPQCSSTINKYILKYFQNLNILQDDLEDLRRRLPLGATEIFWTRPAGSDGMSLGR